MLQIFSDLQNMMDDVSGDELLLSCLTNSHEMVQMVDNHTLTHRSDMAGSVPLHSPGVAHAD
jgi:hypothetical protein